MRTDANGQQIQTTEGGFFTNLMDPHRKIEHWGIRMGIALTLLTGSVGYAGVHHHIAVVRQAMSVSPSGTRVNFSKAQATLTLQQASLSKNGKWAFIPFRLSNMQYLPNNPADYQVLVQAKGSSHTTLSYKPVTRLVLFGSSGKGVIVMYSATGIQNQPITLYLLNLRPLSASVMGDTGDDTAYASHTDQGMKALQKKYDLVAFSANPGAQNVLDAKRTRASLKDKGNLYMDLFGGKSDDQYRAKMAQDQEKIRALYPLIAEDKSKLTQMGYQVPKDPTWMQKNWRPFDAANLTTGKTRNGKSLASYIDNGKSTDATDDQDAVKFPPTLPGKDGTPKMDDQTSNQAQQATALWQDLTTQWTKVESLKRDIYVTQPAKIYQVMKERDQEKAQTTIGPATQNVPISKIRIRTMKLK